GPARLPGSGSAWASASPPNRPSDVVVTPRGVARAGRAIDPVMPARTIKDRDASSEVLRVCHISVPTVCQFAICPSVSACTVVSSSVPGHERLTRADGGGDVSVTTVLVVEDDSRVASVIADQLREEGYRVAVARTLADAETMLSARLPDVVLLDV